MVSMETQELALRAEQLYSDRLKATLEAIDMHQFVAVEPDSGDYFLGATLSEAAARARTAYPDRRSYIMRVGHRAAVHIGACE